MRTVMLKMDYSTKLLLDAQTALKVADLLEDATMVDDRFMDGKLCWVNVGNFDPQMRFMPSDIHSQLRSEEEYDNWVEQARALEAAKEQEADA
jgi:hypothetical protein